MIRVEDTTQPLYRTLADLCRAIKRCSESLAKTHDESIEYLEDNYLPRGSGIDSGCSVKVDESGPDRLVIDVPYHLMDEYGGYRGWWDVVVEVTPSLDVSELNMYVTMDNMDESPMDEMHLESIVARVCDTLKGKAPRYVDHWMEMADFCGAACKSPLIGVLCAVNSGANQVRGKMKSLLPDIKDDNIPITTSPLSRQSSGPDMYEWIWTVGADDEDWGVDVRVEVLYIDPDKAKSDKIDEPYISFTMDAYNFEDGLIKRVGPDTVKSISPVVIYDEYQLDLMWERMEDEIDTLTESVASYIQTRLEEDDEEQKG